jgi:hypothetical protein
VRWVVSGYWLGGFFVVNSLIMFTVALWDRMQVAFGSNQRSGCE